MSLTARCAASRPGPRITCRSPLIPCCCVRGLAPRSRKSGCSTLRPEEPTARLIDLPDGEARRLAWFLSATILVVIILVGFVRYYALLDQASGASHVLGLLVAIVVWGLYANRFPRADRGRGVDPRAHERHH